MQVEQLMTTVKETEPVEHALPGYSWTLKKIHCWVKQSMDCAVSHSTLRTLLKQQGLSWKKCQKVLRKAKSEQRTAFIAEFQTLFTQVCRAQLRLIYIDEAHVHRDLELGYTWAPTGKPAWRCSDCPPLSARLNWYGAYDFTQAQCFLWQEGSCNQANTVKFLQQLVKWLGPLATPVLIIWDGAPWHKATLVQEAAAALGCCLQPLPAYSPDLNPIEGLWKWLRAEVTHNHCHPTLHDLFEACQSFIQRINAAPEQLLARLWPKFELDPDFEKLLLSN
jgi:transposase